MTQATFGQVLRQFFYTQLQLPKLKVTSQQDRES